MQGGQRETRRQNRRQSNYRKDNCARTCTNGYKRIDGGSARQLPEQRKNTFENKNWFRVHDCAVGAPIRRLQCWRHALKR